MRRPRPHRLTPALEAWARPYTGVASMAVFYNGDPNTPAAPEQPPAAPTPGDMPRQARPAKPAAPRTDPNLGEGELAVSQAWLDHRLAGEADAGRRKGSQALASDLGFDDVNSLRDYIKAQKEAENAALSEQERLAREAAEQIQKAQQMMAEAQAIRTSADRRALLAELGATGDDLADAVALLRVPNDATEDDVRAAAESLKARRPEMFGAARAPEIPPAAPPAPSGLPASGPPRPGASQPKPGERGLQMLRRRGKIPSDAA